MEGGSQLGARIRGAAGSAQALKHCSSARMAATCSLDLCSLIQEQGNSQGCSIDFQIKGLGIKQS